MYFDTLDIARSPGCGTSVLARTSLSRHRMRRGGDRTREVRREIAELQHRLDALRQSVLDSRVDDERPTGDFQLLISRVGEERVAVQLDSVERAVPMALLANLPEADPALAGLLNLGGAFVPVIDVAVRLTHQPRSPHIDDLILVVRTDERVVGLVVQEILGVVDSNADQIQDPGAELPHAEYLLGVIHRDEAPNLLISISRLVAGLEIPDDREDAPLEASCADDAPTEAPEELDA